MKILSASWSLNVIIIFSILDKLLKNICHHI